jgi:hypothetical protein
MNNIKKIILPFATLSIVCSTIDLNAVTLRDGKRTAPTEQSDNPEDGREKRPAQNTQEEQGPECCICLNDEQNIDEEFFTTSCNHTFHERCLQGWLLEHSTCPLCRTQLIDRPRLQNTPQTTHTPRQNNQPIAGSIELQLILQTQQQYDHQEGTSELEQLLADQRRYWARNIDLQIRNQITPTVDFEHIRTLCNDPRATHRGIYYALQFAAEVGRLDLVIMLLANPKTTADGIKDALWAASCFGHFDIVSLLLAEPRLPAVAVAEALVGDPEHVNLDVIDILLADQRMTNDSINNALLAAVEAENDTFEILRRLLATNRITAEIAIQACVWAADNEKQNFITELEAWLNHHTHNN